MLILVQHEFFCLTCNCLSLPLRTAIGNLLLFEASEKEKLGILCMKAEDAKTCLPPAIASPPHHFAPRLMQLTASFWRSLHPCPFCMARDMGIDWVGRVTGFFMGGQWPSTQPFAGAGGGTLTALLVAASSPGLGDPIGGFLGVEIRATHVSIAMGGWPFMLRGGAKSLSNRGCKVLE